MWVGKATVFLVGLAVILALLFGALSVAAAHTGSAGLFHLNHNNLTTALSTLTGNVNGAAMRVVNNNAGTDDTALDLSVQSGEAPMKVNSTKKVANLNADRIDDREASSFANGVGGVATNADKLDGKDSSELEPRGYAQVTTSSPFFSSATSKGVIGIVRTDSPGNVYCFDLSFTPRAAVASGHINNNATVGTVIGSGVPSGCTGEFRDAAAVTYGANDTTSAHLRDINFGIVFM
jgi:hypothetical protein